MMKRKASTFRTNANVGVNVPVDELRAIRRDRARRRRHARRAICRFPGRELNGIHFAMEFLPQQNRRNQGDADSRRQIIAPRAST